MKNSTTSPTAPDLTTVRDAADAVGSPARPAVNGVRPRPIVGHERWLVQTLLTIVLVGTNLVGRR